MSNFLDSLISLGVIQDKVPSFDNVKKVVDRKDEWDHNKEEVMNQFLFWMTDGISSNMLNRDQVVQLDTQLTFIDEELVRATEALVLQVLQDHNDQVAKIRLHTIVTYFGALDLWRVSYGDLTKVGLNAYVTRKRYLSIFQDSAKRCAFPGKWTTFAFCFHQERGVNVNVGNLCTRGIYKPTSRYFVCLAKEGYHLCPSSDQKLVLA